MAFQLRQKPIFPDISLEFGISADTLQMLLYLYVLSKFI